MTSQDTARQEMVNECKRQWESCLYTSTALYEWSKSATFWNNVFVIVPIILSGIAAWSIIQKLDIIWVTWVTATFSLLSGVLSSIKESLNFHTKSSDLLKWASEYKNLQDRFRQAAKITSQLDFDVFAQEFKALMSQMDTLRLNNLPIPENHFSEARKKIKHGHYNFDSDN
jgi:hypothetical protein